MLAGFSFPEISGRWTLGRQAALIVSIELPSRPAVLVLTLGAFLLRPDSRITAHFATTVELAEATFTSASTEWRIVLIDAGAGPFAAIGLSVEGATAPAQLTGGRGDLRLLGLRLISAEQAALRPADPGEPMTEAAGHLIPAQGFSGPEPLGRWTDGPRARCLCRLGSWAFGGVRLGLRFSLVHAPDDGELRLVVRPGATSPLHFALPHGEPAEASFIVEPGAIGSDGHVVIDLEVENPSSPLASGLSEDSRELGVLLRDIVATPVVAEERQN
jgi:hypothetical protein